MHCDRGMGTAEVDKAADTIGIGYAGRELAPDIGDPFHYADLAKITQDVWDACDKRTGAHDRSALNRARCV